MTASNEKVMILSVRESWETLKTALVDDSNDAVQVNITSDNKLTKTSRLTFLLTDSQVSAICLASKVRRSGTFEHSIKLQHIRPLENAVAWDDVISAVPNGKKASLSFGLEARYPIPHGAFEELVNALSRSNQALPAQIEELQALARVSANEVSDTLSLVLEQRDAVALGLEIAGIDSRTALPRAVTARDPAPFLQGLEGATTSEASIVRTHDATIFGDWIPEDSGRFDVWRYTDPVDSARKVTVLYTDKERLEQVTGTDLIYFRENDPGYVLVQYKRMKREPTQDVYRPDKQLDDEIARMKAMGVVQSAPASLGEWRLSAEPFYIKLVDPSVTRPSGNRLAQGMYFPLPLF